MTWSKRAFDIFGVIGLIVLLWPFILLISVVILLREGRPVLYLSERMRGPDEPFMLWKFRTMTQAVSDSGVTGADKTGRITPTGAWLRKRRLDELPQLWNILKGDISFVGPRPPLRRYVELFPELYADVLKSRPGVTGLASLRFHAREESLLARCESADETDRVYRERCVPRKATLDLIYQKNRNFCYDISLIWETTTGIFRR